MNDAERTCWNEVITTEYYMTCESIQRRMPNRLRVIMSGEDIVHDAVVSLIEGHNNPRFLRIAADRQLLMRCREADALKRGARLVRGDLDVVAGFLPGPTDEPGAELEARELMGVIVDRARSQRERVMIRLRAEGLSMSEIADKVGCSASRVGQVINRVAK